MKKYTFVLNFGYVESAKLSYLPLASVKQYPNAKAALVDLSSFLKEQFIFRESRPLKKCCLFSKEKDKASTYCSKCGNFLVEEDFDSEEFIDWIRAMSDLDCDSYHSEFIEYDPAHRWEPIELEDAPNQRVVYQAEWVITAALGYPHRDDVTFEDVCKNRTKENRESFSYY